jgi:hypothetical protein
MGESKDDLYSYLFTYLSSLSSCHPHPMLSIHGCCKYAEKRRGTVYLIYIQQDITQPKGSSEENLANQKKNRGIIRGKRTGNKPNEQKKTRGTSKPFFHTSSLTVLT